MKTITIFDLLQMYLNKEPMPKRIKYDMMMDGYKYFRWDDAADEYICEGDSTVLFRCEVPWHHMMDEVKIVNSSEKPNNCETCKFELYCPEMCEGCCEWDSHYETKDEFKELFKGFDREALILLIENQRERIKELMAKTEPQTERSE